MVVITIKYIKPLEAIEALVAEHRKFLDDCYKKSQLICSGPLIPRVGGVLIANVASVDEAQEITNKDPFSINGAAEYQFIEFSPTK